MGGVAFLRNNGYVGINMFCFVLGFFFFYFFFYLFILFIHETKHIYNIIMIEVIAIKEKYNRSAFKRFTIVTLILFNPKLRPCIPLFLYFIFVLGSAFFSIVAAGDLDLGVQ